MRILFSLILLFLLVNRSYAQKETEFNYITSPIKYGKRDYIVGYQYLNYHSFEVGMAKGFRGNTWGISYSNYHVCSELLLSNTLNPVLGVKMGFAATYVLLNVTTQFLSYTNFNNIDYVFRPEIGITVLGALGVNYGYNLFLVDKRNQGISNHLISLRWTFGKGVKDVFR